MPLIERRRRCQSDPDERPMSNQCECNLPVRQGTAHDEMVVAMHRNAHHCEIISRSAGQQPDDRSRNDTAPLPARAQHRHSGAPTHHRTCREAVFTQRSIEGNAPAIRTHLALQPHCAGALPILRKVLTLPNSVASQPSVRDVGHPWRVACGGLNRLLLGEAAIGFLSAVGWSSLH